MAEVRGWRVWLGEAALCGVASWEVLPEAGAKDEKFVAQGATGSAAHSVWLAGSSGSRARQNCCGTVPSGGGQFGR